MIAVNNVYQADARGADGAEATNVAFGPGSIPLPTLDSTESQLISGFKRSPVSTASVEEVLVLSETIFCSPLFLVLPELLCSF